MNLTESMLLFR